MKPAKVACIRDTFKAYTPPNVSLNICQSSGLQLGIPCVKQTSTGHWYLCRSLCESLTLNPLRTHLVEVAVVRLRILTRTLLVTKYRPQVPKDSE